LQLSPAVTELTEYRQALLCGALGGIAVASDHRYLGAGAQRRRDPPLVAECPEACKRIVDQCFGLGRITEIRSDEGVEPFQDGPCAGVGNVSERRRGGMPAALSGEGLETALPGRGRGPGGS
jgi:hypothetical protein